jgi:hypothetical protein
MRAGPPTPVVPPPPAAGPVIRRGGLRRPRTGHGEATSSKGASMVSRDTRIGGLSLGGILVIVGIIVALFWSIILGVIIALVGLIAFGGFVRGKWY